jgi:hypothetical protein
MSFPVLSLTLISSLSAYYDMQQHIISIKFIGRSGKVSTDSLLIKQI